jgi:hypothetical protein
VKQTVTDPELLEKVKQVAADAVEMVQSVDTDALLATAKDYASTAAIIV